MSPASVIMPTAEVADRWVIAKLKLKHQSGDPVELQRQVDYYAAGIDWENRALLQLIEDLEDINETQWAAEDSLRHAELESGDMAEIGRIALTVRNLNRARVAIKNQIVALLKDGFHEVKTNYAEGR